MLTYFAMCIETFGSPKNQYTNNKIKFKRGPDNYFFLGTSFTEIFSFRDTRQNVITLTWNNIFHNRLYAICSAEI